MYSTVNSSVTFLDLPIEIIRDVVLFSPDAQCFYDWNLVCKHTAYSLSENDRERVKEKFKTDNKTPTCNVWWYFNCRDSKTGGIYLTREECVVQARKDFKGVRLPKERERTKFGNVLMKIMQVPFYGSLTSKKVYALSLPPSVYSSEAKACKKGIEFVRSDRRHSIGFSWSKAPGKKTVCNEKWMKEVSGGKKPYDWKKIWEEYVMCDTQSYDYYYCDYDGLGSGKNMGMYKNRIEEVGVSLRTYPKSVSTVFAYPLCGALTKKGTPCKNKKSSCKFHKNK